MLGKQILRTADGTEIQYSLKKKQKKTKNKKTGGKKITKKFKKKKGGGGGGGGPRRVCTGNIPFFKKRWILEKQITTKK